jgi:tetratricopeptide (TPR) repeat protein
MKNTVIPVNRPASEDELSAVLRRAYDFAKKGDYESGLALCDWLIQDASTRIAGMRKRAAIREHQDHIDEAIADLKIVVQVVDSEPADSHSLGLLYLQQQKYEEATVQLRKGVQQCEEESFDYYLNPCRILLAYSLIRQKEFKEARTILQQLPAGYSTYIYDLGNKTKEDLLLQTV